MSPQQNDYFVVIDAVGRAENVPGPYHHILAKVAAFSGDPSFRPHQLLRNGEVVIRTGLHALAVNYTQMVASEHDAAMARAREQFPAPWEKEKHS